MLHNKKNWMDTALFVEKQEIYNAHNSNNILYYTTNGVNIAMLVTPRSTEVGYVRLFILLLFSFGFLFYSFLFFSFLALAFLFLFLSFLFLSIRFSFFFLPLLCNKPPRNTS